jgi:hypothetical protein
MKKFIIQFFFFSLFSFITYIAVIFIIGSIIPSEFTPNMSYPIGSKGNLYTRLNEVKSVKNTDVLFVGSSHAIRSFNTFDIKTMGINCFNLGTKSGTPIQVLTLLKRYLNQLNPEILVFEVYPDTFETDGVEAALHLLANDKIDKYSFEMTFKSKNIKLYNTLVYGIISDILKLNDSHKEDKVRGNDTYFSGGYVERTNSYWTPRKIKSKHIEFKEKQLLAFIEIIELLKSKKIKPLLVFAPVSPSLYESYINIDYFDSVMNSYASYYNFNKTLKLNDSLHFYDNNHMNQRGVDEFTPKIIEILLKEKTRTHNNVYKKLPK